MNKIKIKKFKSIKEEKDFWSKSDLSKNLKSSDFSNVSFPNLKPSSNPISLRIPNHLLVRVKEHANELDMPYQSLIKQYIANGLISKK